MRMVRWCLVGIAGLILAQPASAQFASLPVAALPTLFGQEAPPPAVVEAGTLREVVAQVQVAPTPFPLKTPCLEVDIDLPGGCREGNWLGLLVQDCLQVWQQLWARGDFQEAELLAQKAARLAPTDVRARHAHVVSQIVNAQVVPSSTSAQVEMNLEKTLRLKLMGVTFQEICQDLGKITGIGVRFDQAALNHLKDQKGQNYVFEKATTRQVLNLLTTIHGLGWIIENDVVTIIKPVTVRQTGGLVEFKNGAVVSTPALASRPKDLMLAQFLAQAPCSPATGCAITFGFTGDKTGGTAASGCLLPGTLSEGCCSSPAKVAAKTCVCAAPTSCCCVKPAVKACACSEAVAKSCACAAPTSCCCAKPAVNACACRTKACACAAPATVTCPCGTKTATSTDVPVHCGPATTCPHAPPVQVNYVPVPVTVQGPGGVPKTTYYYVPVPVGQPVSPTPLKVVPPPVTYSVPVPAMPRVEQPVVPPPVVMEHPQAISTPPILPVSRPIEPQLSKRVVWETPQFMAHCDKMTCVGNGDVVLLEGNVELQCRPKGMPMRVMGQRIRVYLNDATFTVENSNEGYSQPATTQTPAVNRTTNDPGVTGAPSTYLRRPSQPRSEQAPDLMLQANPIAPAVPLPRPR